MIVLVGFMGAGKSTVGALLANRLGLSFVDTDRRIEQRLGRTIPEIFAGPGEPAFREAERSVVAETLGEGDAVVALGGGALADASTRAALDQEMVVHLYVSLDEALRRVGDHPDRPLMSGDPKALFESRRHLYENVGGPRVATDGLSPHEVCAVVIERLGGNRAGDAGLRRIAVPLAHAPYEVFVGAGVSKMCGELLPAPAGAKVAALVTHPQLVEQAASVRASLEEAGLQTTVVTVPPGEGSKSLKTAAFLYDELARAGVHRRDLVVGFGGGVVTDIAGFVASTYQRGIAVAHVPTSLLAQVDAAIGGKTGANLVCGKNLVGTFHQPVAVVCDVSLLGSLPDAELHSGMAEVVKYGLIADAGLLETVEQAAAGIEARDPHLLTEIVSRCVRIKAGFVAQDEREQGRRAHLNYGHTFAHAIEASAGFKGIRHGEAVALGMMAAAHLARELGRIEEAAVELHRRALETAGLPTRAALDLEALERAWMHDKKFDSGVRFVLLAAIGKPEAGVRVDREVVARALERMPV